MPKFSLGILAMEGRGGDGRDSMDLGGARTVPWAFPSPAGKRASALSRYLQKTMCSLPTPRRTLHPSLSPERDPRTFFLSLLSSRCSIGLEPPTVPPHIPPRTIPTPAQPALSGPAATSFLACDPHLCQTPTAKAPPKDFSSPASQCNPKAVLSRAAVVRAWQARWGGHTKGKGGQRRELLNRILCC